MKTALAGPLGPTHFRGLTGLWIWVSRCESLTSTPHGPQKMKPAELTVNPKLNPNSKFPKPKPESPKLKAQAAMSEVLLHGSQKLAAITIVNITTAFRAKTNGSAITTMMVVVVVVVVVVRRRRRGRSNTINPHSPHKITEAKPSTRNPDLNDGSVLLG